MGATMLTWRNARRVVVFVLGMTVLLIGIAAMFLPVLQAWLIIPVGLAILATEFVWARKLLDKARAKARQMAGKVRPEVSPAGDGTPASPPGRESASPPPLPPAPEEHGPPSPQV